MDSFLQVASLSISPPVIQAPMSGITGRAFRRLIRELNPGAVGLFYTEFASVEGLIRHNRTTLKLLRRAEEDRGTLFAAQIFGKDISHMAEGAKMAQDLGADMVDINAGCPAPAIVKKGGGAELLKKPLLIGRIVEAVKNAVTVPVSVKIRIGWDDDSINAYETSKIIENSGADMLTIHGRTRMQGFKGSADWEIIGRVKATLRIPLIGNGDIASPEAALEAFDKYKVNGIMIGRAMLKDPWIFRKIKELSEKKPVFKPGLKEKSAVFRHYAELLAEDGLPEKAVLGKMKQKAVKYMRLKPGGSEIRTNALRSNSLNDFFAFADQYFQE